MKKRGKIYDLVAYAQGKLVDCSGWADREKYGQDVLPRKITPSDIDVVFNPGTFMFDNAGHVLLAELSTQTNIWSKTSYGQYLSAQSLVKAGQGKIASVLAYHQTPKEQLIDLRESVESFSLMYFVSPTYACTDVHKGNERWQKFVLAWFDDAAHLVDSMRR
jgi:hypothetical protein